MLPDTGEAPTAAANQKQADDCHEDLARVETAAETPNKTNLALYQLGGYKWEVPEEIALEQCTWLWVQLLEIVGVNREDY